jgi:hypothetical protein
MRENFTYGSVRALKVKKGHNNEFYSTEIFRIVDGFVHGRYIGRNRAGSRN